MNTIEMDRLIENLRCSLCNNYLSISPIVMLPDGTSACGRCVPQNTLKYPDGTVVPQVNIEKILQLCSFPCKYTIAGCTARVSFNKGTHNEDECIYRLLPCPIFECFWKGSMITITDHFTEVHTMMVKKTLSFKLQRNQSSRGIFFAVIDRVPFLLKYVYLEELNELFIRMNSFKIENAFYKLWMFSTKENYSGVSVKREKCKPYGTIGDKGVVTKLDKYMLVLEQPQEVFVKIQVIFERVVQSVLPESILRAYGYRPIRSSDMVNRAGASNLGNPNQVPINRPLWSFGHH